ncbi:hypothetical protein MBLNU230_g0287t1 [Neophaeotheca triangularis]
MRSLDAARDSWQELKQYPSLADLKPAIRLQGTSRHSAATAGLRSACWKAFLLLDTLDTSTWPQALSTSRSAYNSLRMHFLPDEEEPEADTDPLSGDSQSPWADAVKDEELRLEIQQDVDRCMPENLYFRQPETQRMLLDVLFIYCKLNPDIGYRQGMHELAAPVLWAIERDAVDLGQGSKAMGEDANIKAVFDSDHTEHDTFAVFSQIMQNAKSFYEPTTHSGTENPIVVRSRRIMTEMLSLVDKELAEHLAQIDILPQIFLMRWIRLLFGREFAYDDVLTMWDVMFAEDSSLEIVDHVCLAMLLRVRWELLESDYNGALTLLLRYPQPEKEFPAQNFVLDALYLREHMHSDGASYLVLKYTGRPLVPKGRPVTPPALQRNITTFSGEAAMKAASTRMGLSPPRLPRQASNIEAVLQSTAKGIFARGEKLGINKAVRNAAAEVHKRAQEIRESQTPSTPVIRKHRGSHTGQTARERIAELEDRNKQLGKLLEGAVGELWEYQRLATEAQEKPDPPTGESVEQLSLAIAKVQFVQVYLDDSGLPLPNESPPPQPRADVSDANPLSQPPLPEAEAQPPTSPSPQRPVSDPINDTLADPSTFEDDLEEKPTEPSPAPPIAVTEPSAVEPQAIEPLDRPTSSSSNLAPAPTFDPHSSRPTLAQSSFSWMLGQEGDEDSSTSTTAAAGAAGNFTDSSPFSPGKRGSKGYLFGDDGDGTTGDETVVKPRSGVKSKGRSKKKGAVKITEEKVEGYDIGTLPSSPGKET